MSHHILDVSTVLGQSCKKLRTERAPKYNKLKMRKRVNTNVTEHVQILRNVLKNVKEHVQILRNVQKNVTRNV